MGTIPETLTLSLGIFYRGKWETDGLQKQIWKSPRTSWQAVQGVQVQSLVGKLISHMPQGLAKLKKKKSETAQEGMGTQEDD